MKLCVVYGECLSVSVQEETIGTKGGSSNVHLYL